MSLKDLKYPDNILSFVFPYAKNFCNLEKFDELLDKIREARPSISDRDLDSILLHFRDNISYSEIGKKYNVTGARIRQIIAKTLRKLRHPSVSKTILGELVDNAKD